MRSTNTKRYIVIDAPSDLGLKHTGVHKLPGALREAGLFNGTSDVAYAGLVPAPPFIPLRDAGHGILNPYGIRTFSVQLADRVDLAMDLGRFPIVLGGDCSILLGPALALRRRGRFGLFFIDGHADFYAPAAEPNGEVASMELAIVTGRPPSILADLEQRRPLVRERDVVVFGYRDGEVAAQFGSPDVRQSAMHVFSLNDVRKAGVAGAATRGLEALRASGVDGFWVHVDADVLDDRIMGAVDYRMPGGFREEELREALRLVLASPLAVGLDVTIYNPDLDDARGSAGRVLARILNAACANSGRQR